MTTANSAPPRDDDRAPSSSVVRLSGALDLEATYRAARPDVLRMAARRGFSRAEQDEIVQTVGERLVARRGTYDAAKGKAIEWAIGIAKKVIHEAERARETRRRFIDGEPAAGLESRAAEDLTPEESVRAQAALRLAREAWGALTEQQRHIYELTMDGRTAKQIAQVLGIPDTTVELRMKEARATLAAVLRRHREDAESIKRVRGVVMPFVTGEEVEHALRVPRPGRLARFGARVGLPAARLGVGAVLVFVSGVVAGVALFAAFVGPGCGRPPNASTMPGLPAGMVEASGSAAASSVATAAGAPDVPVSVMATSARAAPGATSMVRTAGSVPSAAAAAAGFDPATASESVLLQAALTAPPSLAVEYALMHQKRFGPRNFGKRGAILVRALVALGRRGEAEAHARALKGTIYEKRVEDDLGGPLP